MLVGRYDPPDPARGRDSRSRRRRLGRHAHVRVHLRQLRPARARVRTTRSVAARRPRPSARTATPGRRGPRPPGGAGPPSSGHRSSSPRPCARPRRPTTRAHSTPRDGARRSWLDRCCNWNADKLKAPLWNERCCASRRPGTARWLSFTPRRRRPVREGVHLRLQKRLARPGLAVAHGVGSGQPGAELVIYSQWFDGTSLMSRPEVPSASRPPRGPRAGARRRSTSRGSTRARRGGGARIRPSRLRRARPLLRAGGRRGPQK